MKNKLTVTVGIPAYNEGGNILNAINSVLIQQKGNFDLKKILIISDGSTDNTVENSKASKSKLVEVVKENIRKGKAFRLNQIFRLVNTDILVLLDGDVVLTKSALKNLLNKFESNPKTGLVGSNATPIKSESFVVNIINCGVEINKSASKKWKNGKNIYSFRGSFLGVAKSLYKSIEIPSSPGTDAYLYFSALKNGLDIEYASNSIVYYRLPSALGGHIKQSTRFTHSRISMQKVFGDQVLKEYRIPKTILIMKTIREIKKNPINSMLFILLKWFIEIKSLLITEKISGIWDIATSTKKGIKIL